MKTKEEILFKNLGKGLPNVRSVYYQRTIDAMQEYATEVTKEKDERIAELESLLKFEISDEEIDSKLPVTSLLDPNLNWHNVLIRQGAKWYREELRKRNTR